MSSSITEGYVEPASLAQYFADSTRTATPPPEDRLGAIWNAKWWIAATTIVAAIATLAVSTVVPKVYSSSTDVSIAVSAGASGQTNSLTASNTLAAQYVTVVDSAPVVRPAATELGVTGSDLTSRISAGTVASQNLVRVTVQAKTGAEAQRSAAAVAKSFAAYVIVQSKLQAAAYNDQVITQLKPLGAQIVAYTTQAAAAQSALQAASAGTSATAVSAASANVQAIQSLLNTLLDRQAALTTSAGLQAASIIPAVQLVGSASNPGQIQPKPTLYALIAVVLALAISCQLAIVLAARRRRLRMDA